MSVTVTGSKKHTDLIISTIEASTALRDYCRIVFGKTNLKFHDDQIGKRTFTGTGTNDISIEGAFTGSNAINYVVKIDSGTTYKWSKDNGVSWEKTGVTIIVTGKQIGRAHV